MRKSTLQLYSLINHDLNLSCNVMQLKLAFDKRIVVLHLTCTSPDVP